MDGTPAGAVIAGRRSRTNTFIAMVVAFTSCSKIRAQSPRALKPKTCWYELSGRVLKVRASTRRISSCVASINSQEGKFGDPSAGEDGGAIEGNEITQNLSSQPRDLNDGHGINQIKLHSINDN